MKTLLLSTILIATVIFQGNFTFAQDAAGISARITEIMYNPPESGSDSLEFVEIGNANGAFALDVSGYYFSSGIDYTFPAGSEIPAGGFVLISSDSVVFEDTYGIEAFEWNGGTALSNDGEGLTLRTSNGNLIDTVFFDDTNAWADADGTGYSLVLCDPFADNNLPESWTLSENATGIVVNSLEIFADPGAASTCTTVGISDNNVIATSVYPNPSNGEFRLKMDALDETAQVRIFNTMGQMVFSDAVAAGTTTVDLSTGLNRGHYILTLDKGQELERMKLIVQ